MNGSGPRADAQTRGVLRPAPESRGRQTLPLGTFGFEGSPRGEVFGSIESCFRAGGG